MRKHYTISLLALFTLWCATPVTPLCPTNTTLSACNCVDNVISCGGHTAYDLRHVFDSLSDAIPNERDRLFRRIYINNTAITELTERVFAKIRFEEIVIENATSLKAINNFAFFATDETEQDNNIKLFRLVNSTSFGNNMSHDANLYTALLYMMNVERIHIENTGITALPTHSIAYFSKLAELTFKNNMKLVSLSDSTFYRLEKLNQFVFDGNLIDFIPDFTLDLPTKSNTTVNITLANTRLTSDNFSLHAFDKINRPFILNVGHNTGIKYLNQTIFSSVLSGGNHINLMGAQLECDCRMMWIYQNKTYQNFVHNDYCEEDGNSIFARRNVYIRCLGGT